MFASRTTKDVELAGGYTVTIRKLSARSLEKASEARQSAVTTSAKALGAELIRVFRETAGQTPEEREEAKKKAQADRYGTYDRSTVLIAGIKAWKGPGLVVDAAPSVGQVEDLDEPSAEKLFRAIVDLSDPPKEVAEAEEKNASAPSTAS